MFAMIDLTEPAPLPARRATPGQLARPHAQALRASPVDLGILAHQAAWQAGFRAEAERLERAFAPLFPYIEHVGTTSIPGSAARPIIDIAVGVGRPAAVRFMVETLRGFGYRFNDTPEADFGQQLFVRSQHGLPTHHVHVVQHAGSAWNDLLRFRDVLRADARLAREYEWLRRRFAGRHPANRAGYARAKATFVASVLAGIAQAERVSA